MNKNVGESIMRDDYELVGGVLDPRIIELDIDSANQLHNYVSSNHLLPLLSAYPKKGKVKLSDDGSEFTIMAGSSFGPNLYSAPDLEVSGFAGVSLAHQADSWRLRILTSRYKHDGTPNRVAVRYSLDVAEDLVLQARREVRVIRSRSEEYFNQLLEDDANEPPKAERKAFQRALTKADCERLQERLRQAAGRALATA